MTPPSFRRERALGQLLFELPDAGRRPAVLERGPVLGLEQVDADHALGIIFFRGQRGAEIKIGVKKILGFAPLLLNDEAGIVDDLIVYRIEEEKFLLVVNAALLEITAALTSHLDIDNFWWAVLGGFLIASAWMCFVVSLRRISDRS